MRGYASNRGDEFTKQVVGRMLGLQGPSVRLLDLGCGYCEFLAEYRRHCESVVLVDGVDLEENFAGMEKVVFRRSDVLDASDFLGTDFDVVVASKLIHNIPRELHDEAFGQIAVCTKPGGTCIVSVASIDDPARLTLDVRLSPDAGDSYLSGGTHGREAYRFYFHREQVMSHLLPWFEPILVREFAVASGVEGHSDRLYWMFVGRRK